MAEAKLQKLKVTDLKEMLSKAGLVQSGKKDELVKRLLAAGVTGDDTDELVDLPDESVPAAEAPPAPAPAPAAAAPASAAAPPASVPAPATAPAEPSQPSAPAPQAAEPKPAQEGEEELTEEEKKQKARAERFGIPWVRQKKAEPKPPAAAKPEPKAEKKNEPKEKPAKVAIDATPLGISAEVLARRAAKFGLPEKKAPSPEKKDEKKELSAEEAAAAAAEEEKKRKRAEKFGTAANGTDEPDAKKTKV